MRMARHKLVGSLAARWPSPPRSGRWSAITLKVTQRARATRQTLAASPRLENAQNRVEPPILSILQGLGRGFWVHAGRIASVLCVVAALPDTAVGQPSDAILRARQAIAERRYEAAIDHLTVAIDDGEMAGETLALAHYFRGGTLQVLGRFRSALPDYDRAIALQPAMVPAYMDRGITYYWLGDYARAIADYNRAARLRPEYDLVFVNRGNALQKLGEFDLAVGDYDRAIALNPAALTAYTGRAVAHYRQRDFLSATEDYNHVLARDPNNRAALWGRGLTAYNLGRLRTAALDFAMLPGSTGGYAAIWGYVSTAQAGDPLAAAEQLAAFRDKSGPEEAAAGWPLPLVDLLLGRLTEDRAVARAFTVNRTLAMQRLAEVRFCLGIRAAVAGDMATAVAHLRQAAILGGSDFADPIAIDVSLSRWAAAADGPPAQPR